MTPKPFQEATIRAAIAAFGCKEGTRRFLVADEPGLGKTIVARGVIDCMVPPERSGSLKVLYVCSNQAIAAQNVEQLLGSSARARTGSADRPGLLPLEWPRPASTGVHPPERLAVYSLTPSTAFSSARHPGRGRVEERAFACALIDQRAGYELRVVHDSLRQGTARFDDELREKRLLVRQRAADPAFMRFAREFELLLKASLPGPKSATTWKRLEDMAIESMGKKHALALTALCRNCLSAAALSELRPDLVIFDEFQRFQELLEVDDVKGSATPAEARIREVLTAGRRGRLLMLSATPYEALRHALAVVKLTPAKRGKSRPPRARRDFYHLLRFLWRDTAASVPHKDVRVRQLFEIRDGELSKGRPDSKVARTALDELTALLSQVMCRTERPIDPQPRLPQPASLPLGARDLQSLREFSKWAKRRRKDKLEHLEHAQWIVPLWSSVPLAAQALGARYACWSAANCDPLPVELRAGNLRDWRPPEWSNVKLRWLLQALPGRTVSMPWIKPTAPWWPLRAGWSEAAQPHQIDGKALVFSRFSATPAVVAGTVSFDFEASAVRSSARAKAAYGDGSRTTFRAGGASPAMFRLFFVCEPLVRLDPLEGGGPETLEGARARVATQLRVFLRDLGIAVKRKLRRAPLSLESWLLYLALPEHGSDRLDVTNVAVQAWTQAVLLERGKAANPSAIHARLAKMLGGGGRPGEIDLDREFRPLVELALSSPGIVLARSLLRHWRDQGNPIQLDSKVEGVNRRSMVTPRQLLQTLAVEGFRRYLDRPWFAAALTGRANIQFPDAIQQAVLDGNLEGVLDEHFWFVSSTNAKTWPRRIDELQKALTLNGGRAILHTSKKDTLRVRSNLALPLQPAKDEARKSSAKGNADQAKGQRAKELEARPDTVRHAFNTPFWPMVLTTTSVGQEGLDFHAWCKTIVHWDPAAGPVELEQREGRINRYASLAIRQAIWTQASVVDSAGSGGKEADPGWRGISSFADRELAQQDDLGLAPWWCAPGARFHQFYPYPTGSRERLQREDLERQRAVYRMVLGASEPLWLLDELDAAALDLTPDRVAKSTLRLGAWELEQANASKAKTREKVRRRQN